MRVTWQIFASTADFLFVRPARLKNLTAAGFLFASDPLFTGAMSVVEKTERDPENGDQENGESSKEGKSGNFLDPMKADAAAQLQFQKKYGFKKKPPAMAQRRISQGGKQYFDSGDYNMQESRKDRQEIASHPHVNPVLAQLRAKSSKSHPGNPMSPPSILAGGSEGTGTQPTILVAGKQPNLLTTDKQSHRRAGGTQPSRLATNTSSPLAQ